MGQIQSLGNQGGGGGGTVDQLNGNTGFAMAVGGVINIVGTGDITVTGDNVDTLTITVSGTGLTWSIVTSADNPVNLVANHGYIAKGAGAVNFVLPAASSVGEMFRIVGYGNLWTLAQNALQSVTVGFLTSTLGITGSVSATTISDSLELLTVTANTEFYETGIQGNPTIV